MESFVASMPRRVAAALTLALAAVPAGARGDDGAAPASPMARVACDHIELTRPVVFTHDWDLDAWSFPALDAAAALMLHQPALRVRVEADDLWNDPDRGARVSQSRAREVASYLMHRGVAADRLEAVGFGEDRVTDRSGAPAGVRLVLIDPPAACAPTTVPDDDLDGVTGAADLCPDAAEDLDARDDGDGCPEPARGHVRLECRDVVLDGPVRVSGRRRTLDARSRARLADLAAILQARPDVRLILIEERVHHDPRAGEIAPARRSPAVEDHLAALGVSRDRMHAVLYSMPSMPAGRYQLTFRVHTRTGDCPAPPPAPAKPKRRR